MCCFVGKCCQYNIFFYRIEFNLKFETLEMPNMLKKMHLLLLGLVFVLMMAVSAQAAMQYYYFQGTIDAVADGHGLIDGQNVNYVVGVDFDRVGYSDSPEGNREFVQDVDINDHWYYERYRRDAFYTEGYIDIFPTLSSDGFGIEDDHYGESVHYTEPEGEITNFGGLYFSILGKDFFNGSPEMASIQTLASDSGSEEAFVHNWVVGDILDFKVRVGISSSTGSVSLVSITDTNPMNPVPLPGAVWLLGTGVVALAGLRKKLSA